MRLMLTLLALAAGGAAQDRGADPWSRISRFDTDGDGKVTRAEFTGPARAFERFDTDGDGVLTEEETRAAARGMRRGGGGRGEERGGQLARRFDSDHDGKVSEAEWNAFFRKADENEDGILDQEELAAAMAGRAYNDTAPKVGAPAPAIRAMDGSSRKPKEVKFERPTVLVFGSWT